MENFKKILNKNGWISILESLVFAIIGLVLVLKPEGIITFISYILSIVFICIGIYKIINYYLTKDKNDFYNYNLVYGFMAIIIGIITIIYSSTIGSIFRIIIGIWIIYSSLIRISSSIKLKKLNLDIWIYTFILAIIMLACGIYVTLNPGTIVVAVGIIMIVYSIIDIIETIMFMKHIKEIVK